jgi:NitT/TauT family transport system substrate-binding protein
MTSMNGGKPRPGIRVFAAAALGVAVAAALVLGYLSLRDRPPAQAERIEKLSIASATLPHPALLQIAAANGYFVEEGLDVTVTPVTHGKLALELLLQDKVDLATAAEVPFVLQVLAGQPLGIAINQASSSTENVIVARRDRGISSPEDLIGKKIGVSFGTSGDYFLWAYLIRHKLPPDSVTLVDLPPGPLLEELTKGTVDAIATWQPFVLKAQSALGETGVSFTEANAYTELHVLIGRSNFLKGHPKAIEKLVRALLKAERFNRSEPEQALNLIATRLKMDVQALRPIWNEFKFEVNLQQSQINTLEDEARWAMARGYAKEGPVPNFLPHFYLDALLAGQPGRVTVAR